MTDVLLEMAGVHTHIGHYHILQGVDLSLPRDELTVLLGRNGAGKTTTLRTILSLWRASKGRIRFDGQDITRWRTPSIVRLGMGYVPENMGIFSLLTVQENMRLAADRKINRQRLEWVFALFPALEKFWTTRAGLLSGGQKQMVAIARAIIEPRLFLLIDEPSKGLAPAIVKELMQAVIELKRVEATTILLVEQNFHFAKTVADRVAVMDDGRIAHIGAMADLAADVSLQQRLLGFNFNV